MLAARAVDSAGKEIDHEGLSELAGVTQTTEKRHRHQ